MLHKTWEKMVIIICVLNNEFHQKEIKYRCSFLLIDYLFDKETCESGIVNMRVFFLLFEETDRKIVI